MKRKLGVTKLVCDINVIKLDTAAIFKNRYSKGRQARVLKSFYLRICCMTDISNFDLSAQHLDV